MAFHKLEPGDKEILEKCPECDEGYMVPTMGNWHQCSHCDVEAEEDELALAVVQG